ncbi:ferric reductase-like transmembrane domain-containing protein [Testudinibacter sp. P80/BLE/0925]|uniref:ferric reductase-like transmembrane domain-containing protein n=1 Tax=Testudinibacter sp. TW-1 TaxID=3417757 RepID=UPI003D35EDE8
MLYLLLRIGIHGGCSALLLWLIYTLGYGDISAVFAADPGKELIHFLGLTALYLFSALFLLRILTQLYGNARLRSFHRDLGLWALFWLLLHLVSYLFFELAFDYRLFFTEIATRPYLLIGSLALLLFLAAAVSSLPYLRRKMAKNWFSLHQLSYLAIILGIIHYYWSVKGITLQPLFFIAVAVAIIFFKAFAHLFSNKKPPTLRV